MIVMYLCMSVRFSSCELPTSTMPPPTSDGLASEKRGITSALCCGVLRNLWIMYSIRSDQSSHRSNSVAKICEKFFRMFG